MTLLDWIAADERCAGNITAFQQLAQAHLGKRLSYSTVHGWVTGKQGPGREHAQALSEITGGAVTVEEIMSPKLRARSEHAHARAAEQARQRTATKAAVRSRVAARRAYELARKAATQATAFARRLREQVVEAERRAKQAQAHADELHDTLAQAVDDARAHTSALYRRQRESKRRAAKRCA